MRNRYCLTILIPFIVVLLSTNAIAQDFEYTLMSDSLACDTFPPPRNLNGYSQDDAVLLWWEPPLMVDSLKSSTLNTYNIEVKTVKTTDYSNRDTWDLQIVFPCGDGNGEAGIETDGNYIYTTKWNAGSGTFFEYEMDGTFNGSFTVSGGAMDIRDLAYNDDDGLFYGSNAGSVVWGMNFTTGTVENTINAPINCRAIAYDPDNNGFWANDYSTDITLFDMSGAFQTSFPIVGLGQFYGFAYDNWTNPGTPYLWGHSQDAPGCMLVQMDLNAGGTQIFNMNVTPLVGGTEVAGGLYTHCEAYENHRVTIGGIRQNELIYALELTSCYGPWWPSFVVPQNLLGYNLYRDEELIEYIEYDGSDTIFYWDLSLVWPGCYDYYTTALYDMDLCGFPGDTNESLPGETREICVDIGPLFPFYEDWNTGSFDPNLWDHEELWSVNGDLGYPPPTAVFNGSHIDSNYAFRLTSYGHDCRFHAGTEDPYIDGDIFLEFDIMLNDFDVSGSDGIKVQYTDTSMVFVTIAEFSDSLGSFSWAHQNINMTSYAKGKWIKFAFLAEGEGGSSTDINNWFIDNIELYRTCNPPRDLEWAVFGEILAWHPPIPHTEVKGQVNKELQGYDIYYNDNGFTYLDFTTDTFYVMNQSYGYGPYYITAVYEDCEPASEMIYGPVSIVENNSETEINIYPNPADEMLTISSSTPISQVKLINLSGQVLIEKEFDEKQYQLNTFSLPNGIYIIEALVNDRIIRRKFVVKH